MPIGHPCAVCGQDLSRLSAALDPIYRLPIVVCPRCRAACTRNSQARRRLPRRTRQLLVGLTRMATSIALFLFLSGLSAGLCLLLIDVLRTAEVSLLQVLAGLVRIGDNSDALDAFREEVGVWALGAWAATAFAIGVYLVMALPGLKRWKLTAGFLIMIEIWILGTALFGALDSALAAHHNKPLAATITAGFWAHRSVPKDGQLPLPLAAATLVPAVGLVAVTGRPLGRAAARSRTRLAALRWQRCLRKTRTRRRRG